MDLSERLAKLLTEQDLKHKELCATTGIEMGRFQNLTRGNSKTLRPDEAALLQTHYGYRDTWLLKGKGAAKLTDDEKRMLPALNVLENSRGELAGLKLEESRVRYVSEILFNVRTQNVVALNEVLDKGYPASGDKVTDYVRLPKYDVKASAGNGAVVSDESVVDYLAFSREWIRTHVGCDPKHLALIEVTGDSMQPTLSPNDLILLDTRKGCAVSDGVYVIQLNSSLLVKRIHIQLSGTVEVMSDNTAYKTELVSHDQLTALTIVGRVVWHGKKF